MIEKPETIMKILPDFLLLPARAQVQTTGLTPDRHRLTRLKPRFAQPLAGQVQLQRARYPTRCYSALTRHFTLKPVQYPPQEYSYTPE